MKRNVKTVFLCIVCTSSCQGLGKKGHLIPDWNFSEILFQYFHTFLFTFLSSFNKTHEGQPTGKTIAKNRMTGFSFFLWNGGIEGTDCTPELDIDNVRVVPIK